MKYLTIAFSLLFSLQLSFAQITWNTKVDYEGTGYLSPKPGLIKTIDGNFLFLYERFDDNPVNTNKLTHVLAKYAPQGALLWEKIYDHNEPVPEVNGLRPRGVVQMPDETTVVVGSQTQFIGSPSGYIYITDNDGDSLLYRTYPQYKSFNSIAWHEGAEIITRATDILNSPHLVKIDINSGDIVENQDLEPGGVFLLDNSDYYFSYTFFSDSILFGKHTYDGNLLISNKYQVPEGFDHPGLTFGFSPVFNQTLSGEGMVIYDNAVIEVDHNLNLTLGIPFNENSLNITSFLSTHESDYILPTSDGGYLMSGSVNSVGGDFDDTQVFFIKTNSQGEEEWSKGFTHFDLPANYIPYILEEPDGYVFIRHAYFDGEIYITKMTKEGILTSTSDLFFAVNIDIFPNPCLDYFKLSIPSAYQKGQIRIINTQGQTVQQISSVSEGWNEIIVADLVSGLYFLHVSSEDERLALHSKFIKN